MTGVKCGVDHSSSMSVIASVGIVLMTATKVERKQRAFSLTAESAANTSANR